MRNGLLYPQPRLALHTFESASTSLRWPTVTKGDSESGQAQHSENASRGGGDSRLRVTARLWPTPDAGAFNDGDTEFFQRRERMKAKHNNGNGMGVPLAVSAAVWPTATAQDAVGSRNTNAGHSGTTLTDAAKLWGTPTAHKRTHDRREVDHGAMLANQASAWPTPMANDGVKPSAGNRRNADLSHSASSHPVAALSTSGHECSESCRRLNPLFAQWLMGFPLGWTNPDVPIEASNFAAWETESSRLLLLLLSEDSL